jgi:hypothetical protein
MSSGTIAVVIVALVIIIVVIAAFAMMARRRRLQQQFGPEYDRAVDEQNSKLRAEAELTDRQRRVRKLDIKPLSEPARAKYTADWVTIQERFVDSPDAAVTDAYVLVTTVMTERGYPTDDDEQVLADLSVEHAQTVGHFRAAREITKNAAAGSAATEDLRQALIHYRALFADLLGEPDTRLTAPGSGTVSNPAAVNGHQEPPAAVATDPDGVAVGTPASAQPDPASNSSNYGGTP